MNDVFLSFLKKNSPDYVLRQKWHCNNSSLVIDCLKKWRHYLTRLLTLYFLSLPSFPVKRVLLCQTSHTLHVTVPLAAQRSEAADYSGWPAPGDSRVDWGWCVYWKQLWVSSHTEERRHLDASQPSSRLVVRPRTEKQRSGRRKLETAQVGVLTLFSLGETTPPRPSYHGNRAGAQYDGCGSSEK